MKSKVIAVPYVVWMCIFIVVPTVFVGYFAFTDSDGAFTLNNVMQISKYSEVLWRSILYAAVATVVSLLFGYVLAYVMSHLTERFKTVSLILLMLPMWINSQNSGVTKHSYG